jgi:hypothetical protein
MNLLARLPRGVRYAIFALPMAVVLALGVIYLAYGKLVCDPLYADNPQSAGYDSGPGMSALRPLVPAGFQGDTTIPTPRQNFGVTCR